MNKQRKQLIINQAKMKKIIHVQYVIVLILTPHLNYNKYFVK